MNRLLLASVFRRSAFIAGLAALCLGTGCGPRWDEVGGGQTGGESPVPALSGGCTGKTEARGLDALTPLGATAETVLAPVLGSHTAPLLWRADTGALTLGPEQGVSQVELTATYAGGPITWVQYRAEANGDAGSPPSTCPLDSLDIELEVRLRTGGRALDETLTVRLGAVAVDNARFTHVLDPDSLQGSFRVTAPVGVETTGLQITAVWDAFGFRGELLGQVEMSSPDPNAGSTGGGSVGFGFVPFADWPAPTGNSAP